MVSGPWPEDFYSSRAPLEMTRFTFLHSACTLAWPFMGCTRCLELVLGPNSCLGACLTPLLWGETYKTHHPTPLQEVMLLLLQEEFAAPFFPGGLCKPGLNASRGIVFQSATLSLTSTSLWLGEIPFPCDLSPGFIMKASPSCTGGADRWICSQVSSQDFPFSL